jgi:hypothetical protein
MIRPPMSWLFDPGHLEMDDALIGPVSREIDEAAGAEHTCLFRIGSRIGQEGGALRSRCMSRIRQRPAWLRLVIVGLELFFIQLHPP